MTAPVVLMRELVPGMKQRRWGRVVHISSIAAVGSTEGRHGTDSSLLTLHESTVFRQSPTGVGRWGFWGSACEISCGEGDTNLWGFSS